MMLDSSLTFNTNLTSTQAVTATANSTTVIDVTGVGVGNKPTMINSFPASAYQSLFLDIGVGDGIAIPYVMVFITGTTTVTGTLNVALQAAPDDGSTNSPGTYTTLYQSAALTGATQLAAGKVLYFQVPPTLFTMGEAQPRFYRLVYTVVSGSISIVVNSVITINPSSFGLGGQFNNNFIAV